jgi:hypothetical protein
MGAERLGAGAAGAAAAVRGGPGAVSRGVAVDRAAGEPGAPRGPVGRLERAQRRAWDAERRSLRPGRPGDPGAAAHPGARLPRLADVPPDALPWACAALGLGPLVWRPQADHPAVGGRAHPGPRAAHRPVDGRARPSAAIGPVAGLDGSCRCAKKCPQGSAPMGDRPLPPWCRERRPSGVGFITSRG